MIMRLFLLTITFLVGAMIAFHVAGDREATTHFAAAGIGSGMACLFMMWTPMERQPELGLKQDGVE